MGMPSSTNRDREAWVILRLTWALAFVSPALVEFEANTGLAVVSGVE